MNAQTTLTRLKPQAQQILTVLMDGETHSATEFKRGTHGVWVDAVSQRIGELRKAGYDVRNIKRDGGVASYQLVPHGWYNDGSKE